MKSKSYFSKAFFLSFAALAIFESVVTLKCLSRVSCVITAQNKNISFASYNAHQDKFFDFAVFETIIVSGTEAERHRQCLSNCTKLGFEQCNTVNVAPYSEIDPSNCLLSRSVLYASSSGYFVNRTGWTNYHLLHQKCEAKPCRFGHCKPDYITGNYTCGCWIGRTGRHCEVRDWKGPAGGYWNFDSGDMSNNGTSTELALKLGTGEITYEPGRKTKVLLCKTSNCFSISNDFPCIGNGALLGESGCLNGGIFAFWFRALRLNNNNIGRLWFVGAQEKAFEMLLDDGFLLVLYSTKNTSLRGETNIIPQKVFNQWNHVMFKYDEMDKVVFINGKEYILVEKAGGKLNPTIDYQFGHAKTTWFLDDIVFLNGAFHRDVATKIFEDTTKN